MLKVRTFFGRRWGLALSALLWASAASAADVPSRSCDPAASPQYADFAVAPETIDTRPELKLNNAFARKYRTALREALRDRPVDFAGHYVMVTFGCGTTCMYGGWVDAQTGEAFALPGILDSFGPFDIEDPLLYRAGSRLIIALGAARGDEERPEAGYYEWTGTELRPLCTRRLTEEEAMSLGRAPSDESGD
ncbi:MAG: hypothetical protein CVT81_09405 [Alphaproteobacteria bacterium HGW-Alphaproteobacteria-3]|nr:MAG: hypothetical protein CVT81_09405 [Alphaproteobacteria bacterium HGW-Alphaproteobacteria-3]